MDFGFVRDMVDEINHNLLSSSMVVMATINIKGEGVSEGSESGDVTDGRYDSVQMKYPSGVNSYYRIQVFPIQNSSLKANDKYEKFSIARFEPVDFWFACFESDALIRKGVTMFDYAESVDIEKNRYKINGIVRETLGHNPTIYVFLQKT